MQVYGLEQTIAPLFEPVDLLADAKGQSRIPEIDAENYLLTDYAIAAREYFETVTGRQIAQTQYRLYTGNFPGRRPDDRLPPGWRWGEIRLPKPPLISVDEVKYIDTDGNLTLLATTEYQWSKQYEPARLRPARFKTWPVTDPQSLDAVQIKFTCGWATTGAVPARIRQAIRLLTAHFYEYREAAPEVALNEMPFGLKALINSMKYGEYV